MNFDLNINNYKKNELQEMFDLPQNYDKLLVDNKETKLSLPSTKDWIKIVLVMCMFALLQGLLTYYFI